MKIAYDYQIFTTQIYGGVSRYYKDLVNNLLKQDQEVNIFTGVHRNLFAALLPKAVVKGIKLDNYPLKTGRAFLWLNHVICQIQMQQWKPDIIHETYYSSKHILKSNAVRVTTVHDMIHELYPGNFFKWR